MKFDTFLQEIPKVTSVELPSVKAHMLMAPLERVSSLDPANYKSIKTKKAAVMMLFYPKEGITHLSFIIRNSYPGVHSSQIAFPGGKVEKEDFNLQHTALRETYEEIGIHPNQITVMRPFTQIYIPPSNFLVHPFLGVCNEEISFTLQVEEVAGMVELPLSELMNDAIIVQKTMDTSYAKAISVPCFKVGEHYIWGATAMMMSELKETLKMIF